MKTNELLDRYVTDQSEAAFGGRTTVRRRWVSERLGMGDESRVTKAIRRVKQGAEPNLPRLKRMVEKHG